MTGFAFGTIQNVICVICVLDVRRRRHGPQMTQREGPQMAQMNTDKEKEKTRTLDRGGRRDAHRDAAA